MIENTYSPHILIVEGESAVTEKLKALLDSRTDYHVHTAINPVQAVAALRSHPVDIVITDVSILTDDETDCFHTVDCSATIIVTGNCATGREKDNDSVDVIHYKGNPWGSGSIISVLRFVVEQSGLARKHIYDLSPTCEGYIEKLFRFVAAIDFFDEYTCAHVLRIGMISHKLAQLSGEEISFCHDIQYASIMHDVGKIGVPRSIVKKRGLLNSEEYNIMKTHTEIGADIFDSPDDCILAMAGDIARCHHENWDGSGYPYGLQGDDIPKAARIVAIADLFDALLSERSYKPSFLPEKCRI